ncbi:innexin 7 [Penaeus vannamei]|uniref:Innexin n=1 Tax=Penaeus vannamei TaxID=6689 RepID=A0A423U120_PENVA|nr:innexin 7 [Penaeus vannamei]
MALLGTAAGLNDASESERPGLLCVLFMGPSPSAWSFVSRKAPSRTSAIGLLTRKSRTSLPADGQDERRRRQGQKSQRRSTRRVLSLGLVLRRSLLLHCALQEQIQVQLKMVVNILGALVGLVKVRVAHTNIDSSVFRLHYRWTTSFCYLACLLVAASDFIGNPITCMSGGGVVAKPINTYCWIESTFTINISAPGESSFYHGNTYHGVGQYDPEQHTKTYHAYYQWVPFVLFFQGCLFYLPHLLWKAKENKMANTLLQGLNRNSICEDTEKKKENIIKYMKVSNGRNGCYSIVYLVCEALNFVNVIGQMFLLDRFFGGAFIEYGLKVINFDMDDDEAHDPLATTFPRVTQCSFKKFGASGTIETRESLCILPQNILNEKLVWRIVLMASPLARIKWIEQRGKLATTPKVEQGLRQLPLGDYFLLDIMSENLDAITFKDILLGCTNCPDEANPNNGSYRPFPTVDDDDPVSYKRQMEALSDTAV